jgi:hypothetical protein
VYVCVCLLNSGEKMKDIVDGQLVEEVDDEEGVDEGDKAVLAAVRAGREENKAVRREVASVKKDVAELKDMLKAVLAQGKV